MSGDAQLVVAATCNASCASSTSGIGNQITVSVERQFDFITPLMDALFPGTGLIVRASATAPIL
jgi:hypothetical protein